MSSRVPAIAAPDIPTSAEDLTPEWLTAALRRQGCIADARVTSFTRETLGAGEGFVGHIVRFALEFDRREPGAPASVIGKFPIRHARNRQLGEALGAYEREIRFYQDLASRIPIQKPDCYYAAMDPNPLAGREDEVFAFLERLPLWLVRLAVPFGLWLASKSRRRYALILEDLGDARLGDQVAGCTAEEAELLVRSVAAMHAHWWEHVDLPTLTFAPRLDVLPRYLEVLYKKSRSSFFEGFGAELPARVRDLAVWLEGNGIPVLKRLGASQRTLLHGDCRLDNLFFHDDAAAVGGAARGITLFDWQTVSRGPGAFDVAYFISGNLPEAVAARAEMDLLRSYHEELVDRGVDGYDFDACLLDYQLSKLFIMYRLILGADLIDFSDERGTRLISGWLERLTALLPEHYDRVLRDATAPAERRGAAQG